MSHIAESVAVEDVGPLCGRSNTVTRSRRAIAPADGPVDESAARRRLGDRSKIHDLAVHGVRVRLFTNSHHLAVFARRHFWSAAEWRAETGTPLGSPRITIYAVTGLGGPESSRYDEPHRVGLVADTACFGTLRAMILSATGRLLERESGVLTLEASAVGWGDHAVLFTGDPRARTELVAALDARFISDGFVHVKGADVYAGEKHPYAPATEPDPDAHYENVLDGGIDASPDAWVLANRPGAAHPMESVPATCLFHLRRDPSDRVVGGPHAGPLKIPSHALNLVRPAREMARLVDKLVRHPPERLHITADSLEGYLR